MDKSNFTVIKGKNIKVTSTKQKWELYKNAYDNLMVRCFEKKKDENKDENISDTFAKMFFYGTRYITLKYQANQKSMFEPRVLNYDELRKDFAFVEFMYQVLDHLTLKQVIQMFPIDKEYDGKRYGCKDYFYSMEHLKGIDSDDLLCNQFTSIDDFTWIYWNRDIFDLEIVLMEIASDIRRFEGKKSIAEEWTEKQGLEFYTISTDGTMKNSKGEKIGKVKPSKGFKVVSKKD